MSRPARALVALVLIPASALAQPRPPARAAVEPPPVNAQAVPAGRPAAPPAPSGADLSPYRALAIAAAGDPDIAELQAGAAREAEGDAPDRSYPRRARLAALVPRVTAEVRREEQSNRVVGLQGSGEVDYLRISPGNTFLVRATWDLGQLVAAPGELQAGTQAAARAQRRAEAVARVTKLHFERRRLRVGLLLEPPASALERARAELEVERIGAEIDALTGGLGTGRGR